VDDSLTTRMLEQSILESAGYAVELATSGEEALEKARRRRYALFLVDVEMPGMDGFELLERLQSDPGLRRIPSILVTSRSSQEDRRRGAHVGASAYVVKSEFDQVDLLRRIGSLMQTHGHQPSPPPTWGGIGWGVDD
jgi:two-component system chemotaxis sensor kinase CheA